MDKVLIAHELGHVVSAYWKDVKYIPTSMVLSPGAGSLAYTNFCERKNNLDIIVKFNNISALGGIFGEIMMEGKWCPWGARSDIDEFICENQKSRSKLISELQTWLWASTSEDSFFDISRRKTFEKRRSIKYSTLKTRQLFPDLWKFYVDFYSSINVGVFLGIVDDISVSEKIEYKNEKLITFSKKCLGGLMNEIN